MQAFNGSAAWVTLCRRGKPVNLYSLSGEQFILKILEKKKKILKKKILIKFLKDNAASSEVKRVSLIVEMSLLSRSDIFRYISASYMAIKI